MKRRDFVKSFGTLAVGISVAEAAEASAAEAAEAKAEPIFKLTDTARIVLFCSASDGTDRPVCPGKTFQLSDDSVEWKPGEIPAGTVLQFGVIVYAGRLYRFPISLVANGFALSLRAPKTETGQWLRANTV